MSAEGHQDRIYTSEYSPAAAVRGPKHVVTKRKTPVLTAEETRELFDSLPTETITGLHDRALIGTLVYSFTRIGAVVTMSVEDVFHQGRRLWVRLHENGGKEHTMPTHHNLETYLLEYLEGAGIREDTKSPPLPHCPREKSGVAEAEAAKGERPAPDTATS